MTDVCPRCGAEGSVSVERRGGRYYVYYVHTAGKKRVKHYVGPADSYTHVEKLHSLNLRNLRDVDYISIVELALSRHIDNYMRKHRDSGHAHRDLIAQLKRIVRFCEERIRELESLEAQPGSAPLAGLPQSVVSLVRDFCERNPKAKIRIDTLLKMFDIPEMGMPGKEVACSELEP